MKPMRMLVLLAVFWAAGSLLLAAESPSTPKPAATAKKTEGEPQPSDKSAADKKPEGDKTDAKADTKEAGKGSIADQAEAALKAAAEADPGAASKEPPKIDEQGAKDDTQLPPSASKGPSPQRFTPTEQVRADFDVSFPIDI